ncbi:MAG: sigma-70 family RNA polymerase sigma factor [Oscillospiraceae bacterium]|nr:sigma-70 family RNA polymerase sigma factor [Oscillospiraceae bacterium]
MTDGQIAALFRQRDERALAESEAAYGAFCRALAEKFVSAEDAQECWSDALLRAWDTVPSENPAHLRAYFARLTRNLALDRFRRESAAKRGGREADAVLSELAELLGGRETAESAAAARELGEAVNRFVASLTPREGDVFVRRCFFAEKTAEIAKRYGMSEGSVKTSLSRTRKKLKTYLESEGYV